MPKLEIIYCDAHDHVAVFIDEKLVYCHDLNPEAVLRVANHLNWQVITSTINRTEFENRFA